MDSFEFVHLKTGPFKGWYVSFSDRLVAFWRFNNGEIQDDDIFGPFETKALAKRFVREIKDDESGN